MIYGIFIPFFCRDPLCSQKGSLSEREERERQANKRERGYEREGGAVSERDNERERQHLKSERESDRGNETVVSKESVSECA